jgi:adenine-specific DNA-methyltransferase
MHQHDRRGTPRARSLRKQATRAEQIVWRWLRDRRFGGWKFRRQYPIGLFIADFYCDRLKLVIELDGSGHQYRAEYDSRRTADLTRMGISVVRISNEVVRRSPDAAGDAIIAAILERLPLTRRFAARSPEGEGSR